jgi:hypothetical protein
VHDSVEVPNPPEMLVADRVHVRLVELVVADSATVPVNPFSPATLIVDVPGTPTLTVILFGTAVIKNPGGGPMLKVTAALWDRVPLVPVTVAVKLPVVEAVHERIDVPEPPLMLAVDRVHVRLVELVVTARDTVPVKPFTGETVIVDMAATPCAAVMLVGLAAIVKSGCATVVTW